ncbi:hypothetical protein NW768_009618 [Fusarium equiseti]|uniref:Uncharacterized protein n=1 Tax=Fusarium equiseti TaxID=61235 RepID=A0ABQ8R2T1_FUSEQ|nr:hypothetical protein NW768_009618 [Fusarium equiseti]
MTWNHHSVGESLPNGASRRSSSASERSTQASLANGPASSQTSNHDSEDSQGESDEEGSEAGSEVARPTYTAHELVAIILDFYQFLTTLHFDPEDLKVAPPEGWPSLTPELLSGLDKSDKVIEFMRHIPYFKQRDWPVGFHYKSQLCDIPEYTEKDIEEEMSWAEDYDFGWDDAEPDQKHYIRLADGMESGAHLLWLNVKDGMIIDYELKGDSEDPVDVQVYFNRLKDQYRRLVLVPGPPGIITADWEEIDEVEDEEVLTEEQFPAQGEDIDRYENVAFARKLYRSFGWPDAFRREECWEKVDKLQDAMEEMEENIWEGSPLSTRRT